MRPLSALVLAAFSVSCFAEVALLAPGGVVGALFAASVAALLPGLLDALVAPVVFRPDVTVAVDPLAPEARPLASAVQAALRQAVSAESPVRLLIARAPGFDLRIDLNAVRSRGFAEIRRAGSTTVVSSSQAALPPFTCGDETASLGAPDAGENARVVILPAASGRSRLRVVPHRLNAWPAAITEVALLAIMAVASGMLVAMATVALPGGCALAARFFGTARKQGSHPLRCTTGVLALHLLAIAVTLSNFARVAVW